MLCARILTVAALLPCFLLLLFFSTFQIWGLVLLLVVFATAVEWARLGKWRPMFSYGYGSGFAAIGFMLLAIAGDGVAVPEFFLYILSASALFWVSVVFFWLHFKWQPDSPVLHGALGIVMILPLWLSLLLFKENPGLMLAAMAIVWVSDSAAYFSGHRWGRRKLAPAISPGKTWEGVYGALFAVALYTAAAAALWPVRDWKHAAALVVLSMFLAILGIAGDLFESLAKRQAGVKDSGTLLPGHGGVLDRIDALLPSMPVAALVYWFFIR